MCTPTPTQPQKEASSTSVVDLGLQIREGGWGGGVGGRGGHPEPEIRGSPVSKKIFLGPFGPQFGLKIEGWGAPLDPPLHMSVVRAYVFLWLCVFGCFLQGPIRLKVL